MFASIKKSCIFVLGLSKEVLSPINLLVISFSVINYVVSVSCRREGHNSFLFYTLFRMELVFRQKTPHYQSW